jgi:hypothetical protein
MWEKVVWKYKKVTPTQKIEINYVSAWYLPLTADVTQVPIWTPVWYGAALKSETMLGLFTSTSRMQPMNGASEATDPDTNLVSSWSKWLKKTHQSLIV